jgi:cytochrome P450
MLTSLTGDQWKSVRSVFTPIFTSGKMKGMLKFIKLVGDDLCEEMESKAKEGEEFELKDVFGKFSLDALASAAFGVDGESFKQKDSIFVKNAANFFKFNTLENIVLFLKFLPGVAQFCEFFKINTMKPRETRFFRDIVLQTIRTRRETKVKRNDLIDMMLECLKNDVQTEVENEPPDQYEADMKLTNNKKSKKNIDETTVIATLMVLLVAGYDTTGMTLSYLAYELSKNPEIQEKLQAEIDEAMEESDGELPDYNVIQSLPYLDMVVHETLRFHCPVGGNIRVVTQDYTIPDTDLVLRKDDMVSFSTRGLHFDPKHWTHPSEFYPEHFSKEEKAARNPYAFQAFGQGPRACIGMRFALLEAKVATIAVLSRFSFKPGTKTKEPLVLEPETTLAWPKGGLWVRIEKRDNM